MKIVLLLLLATAAGGCYIERPIKTEEPENNATYKVDYLFEHEGCKVYRFRDRGKDIYFTNCNGDVISVTDSTQVRNRINATRHS